MRRGRENCGKTWDLSKIWYMPDPWFRHSKAWDRLLQSPPVSQKYPFQEVAYQRLTENAPYCNPGWKGQSQDSGKGSREKRLVPIQRTWHSDTGDGEMGRAPVKRPGFQKVPRGLISFQWTVMGIGVGGGSSDWSLKDRYFFRKSVWCHEKNNV